MDRRLKAQHEAKSIAGYYQDQIKLAMESGLQISEEFWAKIFKPRSKP